MSKTIKEYHENINAIFEGRAVLGKDGTVARVAPIYEADTLDDGEIHATGKEPVGSIRQIVDAQGNGTVYRKQVGGHWAPVDSDADLIGQGLTGEATPDILSGMANEETTSTKRSASLIPAADTYLDNGFNVLLIGLHGTGKTETIKQLARDRGLKMKYYSCSTLDPYTDLVGVPTPRYFCPEDRTWHKEDVPCPDCGGKLVESLKMVRPRDVDEAELIFFDEFNRADAKTQNAVFEIIQFKSINGEPLPNLKACWAAINPPDDEQNYQVEQLDPALLDRFDVYIEITPKPSVVYMSQHMPEPIARALKRWWDDHMNAIRQGSKDAHSDYISPRRLEKIGLVWCATKSSKSVFASLPMGGNFEKQKLVDFLKAAQTEVDTYENQGVIPVDLDYDEEDEDVDLGGSGLGDRPWDGIKSYKPANLQLHQVALAQYLKDNPTHYETHKAVVNALKQGVGGEELVLKHSRVLNALSPSSLEGLIAGFPPAKVSQMRSGFMKLYKDDQTFAKTLGELHKQLKGAHMTGWPKTL